MSGSDGDPFSTGAGLGVLSDLSAGDEEALIGRELDGYKITGFIAEGGMSRVYRATRVDGSFERDVAIKLSAISGISSTMRERFMQEQSVLAGLNHPHISQLYDARLTSEGWPYIVMELVEGRPITGYCSERSLGLDDRVRLLIDVIDAVAFAHGNLVVHRDLKPSNVLVTESGEVKLLDFGIAKLLEGDAGNLTRSGAMTPRYASPEQLLGKPISIASDVYQLGLLMAEVLGGGLPTEGESLTEAIQRSADDRPVMLPGRMRQALPGEITLIIEQCLRVQPGDRYRDANALRSDLEAYLSGYPVSAVGQRPGYRFRKFVQRNRGGVLGASLTLLALISATVVTALQMLEAKQQRDIAVYQQQRVQATSEFYSLLLEEMGDGTFTSVDMLDRGRTLLEDQFGTAQPFMASVLFDVSKRYANLGEMDQQRELLTEAERIARDHGDDNVLAAVLCGLARGNQARDPELATEQLAQGVALYERLPSPAVDTSVECFRTQSNAEVRAGNYMAALEPLFAAQQVLDQHPQPGTRLRALILSQIAFAYFYDGQIEKAIAYLDDVLELLESSGRGATLLYQRLAANRAVALGALGRTPDALDAFADLRQRMQAGGLQGRGAIQLAQHGNLLLEVGRMDDAAAVLMEGLAIAESAGDDRIASALNMGMVKVHLANAEFGSAREYLAAAEAYVNGGEPKPLVYGIRTQRAKLHRLTGELDAAVHEIDELLADMEYPDARRGSNLNQALAEGVEIHRESGDNEKAAELVNGLVERLEEQMRPGS
ncbi:MAG: serine/threonine-protein kinase, partial [Woeseiaceae bacterium]|nr:serine/threonine-protein kinase [Woeseiaceae bacterium]